LPAFRTLSPDALRNKHRELVQEVCSVEKDNRAERQLHLPG
jgi:hypothetical protein